MGQGAEVSRKPGSRPVALVALAVSAALALFASGRLAFGEARQPMDLGPWEREYEPFRHVLSPDSRVAFVLGEQGDYEMHRYITQYVLAPARIMRVRLPECIDHAGRPAPRCVSGATHLIFAAVDARAAEAFGAALGFVRVAGTDWAVLMRRAE